jgi:hypothetical protein
MATTRLQRESRFRVELSAMITKIFPQMPIVISTPRRPASPALTILFDFERAYLSFLYLTAAGYCRHLSLSLVRRRHERENDAASPAEYRREIANTDLPVASLRSRRQIRCDYAD